MFKGELFLAWRYLKPQKTTISLLTYVSLLGPILGVGILVAVTSVFNGVPHELEQKIIDYRGHITIESRGSIEDISDKITYLEKNYPVKVSPLNLTPVLIQKENGDSEFLIAKGIYPDKDREVSKLKDWLSHSEYALGSKGLIISKTTAEQLNLKIGDEVSLHSLEKYKNDLSQESPPNDSIAESAKIVNLFSSNVAEVDKNFMVMHKDFSDYLISANKNNAMQLEIATADPYKASILSSEMRSDPKLSEYSISSWQERDEHRDFIQLINSQKALMMFVLFFIVMGAALGVAACLFSIVIQKTQEIGILKATGISPLSIIQVFVGQGTVLGIIGSLLGLVGGMITLTYRQEVADLIGAWDKELYKVKTVPMYCDTTEITFIVLGSIIICSLASFIPAAIAASVNPVKALQSQG